MSTKRDLAATRRFFTQALQHSPAPTDVTTDRAPAYPRVLDALLPARASAKSGEAEQGEWVVEAVAGPA